MFDPSSFAVGGISLIVLVFGLVEFIKDISSLSGKAVTALSALIGAVIMGLYQLQSFLPPIYAQIYVAVISSITFGLSASGYYKFLKERIPETKPSALEFLTANAELAVRAARLQGSRVDDLRDYALALVDSALKTEGIEIDSALVTAAVNVAMDNSLTPSVKAASHA